MITLKLHAYLIGTIPASYSNFTRLTKLRVHNLRLSGCVPHTFGSLTLMKRLLADNNRLSCNIPPQLSSLVLLDQLLLAKNWLSGTVPSELRSVTRIKHLRLYDNWISGTQWVNYVGYLLYSIPALTSHSVRRDNQCQCFEARGLNGVATIQSNHIHTYTPTYIHINKNILQNLGNT